MKTSSPKQSLIPLAFASIVIGFGAASSAQPAEKSTAMPTVSEVWVKPTIPGASVSAAYMQIKSATPIKLIKVESSSAGIVEIHDMKMNDGVMEMKALDAVDVGPGKLVRLAPGGMHVMLMKVKKPISKGDKVPLILTFEDAGKKHIVVKLDATARENNAGGHQH